VSVLVLGGNGQVGRELLRAFRERGEQVIVTTRSGVLEDGTPCERADLDQPDTLPALLDHLAPDAIINAAAYTAVDRAEVESDAAFRVNAEAPGVIARWCAAQGVPLVHYSTDYVFDGRSAVPYREEDPTHPLSVYGASKWAGEEAIRAAGGRHLIFRTAWVYASHSHNFLRTMLRVGAERDELRVVADQFGTPTPARLVADTTLLALRHPGGLSGTWHLTASGETSWYGFAEAIFAEALAAGCIARAPAVVAIATADYPTPATRPARSLLDNRRVQHDFDTQMPAWRDGLKQVIAELAAAR